MKTLTRKTYIDFLRVLANFLVIFNHTIACTLYQNTHSTIKAGIYMIPTILTQINIPIFLMISGALLLGKEESISHILKKRVLRFFLLLVCTSTVLFVIKMPHAVTPYMLLHNILTCYIDISYWYLYAYLAFLITLPYLRRMVRNFTKNDFLYILIIHFVISSIVPILDYILYQNSEKHFELFYLFQLPLMTVEAFFYPIIGYYLDKQVDVQKITIKKLLLLFVACIFSIAITMLLILHRNETPQYADSLLKLFDYVLAISVFIFVKYLFTKYASKKIITIFAKVASIIAPLTLGIYVLDPYWKYLFEGSINRFLEPYLPIIFTSVIYVLISMLVGGLVTFILRLIPGIKKIL